MTTRATLRRNVEAASAFRVGQRVAFVSGGSEIWRGDVLAIAKNGSIRVERWAQLLRDIEPRIVREWVPARLLSPAVPLRSAR